MPYVVAVRTLGCIVGGLIASTLLASGSARANDALDSPQPVPPVICLDPGHPSFEGDKLFEGILNRKVAALLETMLVENGLDVVVTVRDLPRDELLAPGFDNESPEEQARLTVVSPGQRRDMCLMAGASIVVSIHHNYLYDPTINHAAVLFSAAEPRSLGLAQLMVRQLRKAMRVESARLGQDTNVLGAPLIILQPSSYVSILTEASFYSHPKERARLNTNRYLKKEAHALMQALRLYLDSEAAGEGLS